MGLRILLADDSSTIKKVFQLALQDYAVEVQTVAVGVDVIAVAQEFSPDIIFADILLKKRSGYLVCSDVKSHPTLDSIPVVLIWSGFIDLDQDKYQASGAQAELEKPFEVAALRKIVLALVPKTQSQKLGNFLSMPKPSVEPTATNSPQQKIDTGNDSPHNKAQAPASAAPGSLGGSSSYSVQGTNDSSWDMDSFSPIESPEPIVKSGEDEDQFSHVSLDNNNASSPLDSSPAAGDETLTMDDSSNEIASWVQKDLTEFKLDSDSAPEGLSENEYPIEYNTPYEEEGLALDPEQLNTSSAEQISVPTTPVMASPEPVNLNESIIPSSFNEDSYTIDDEVTPDSIELGPPDESMPEIKEHIQSVSPIDAIPKNSTSLISPSPQSNDKTAFTEEQLEAIIKTQSLPILEKVIWQVVPELARQIIEKELHRLLEEKEKGKM